MDRKVVFRDAGVYKVAVGHVSFDDGFINVTNDRGRQIFVNNNNVILIKDLEG